MTVAATLPTQKQREVEAKGWVEMWSHILITKPDGMLLLTHLGDAIRKGYYRMGPEGELLLTEKGAWREIERAKRMGNGKA